jgi:hypothetical protein
MYITSGSPLNLYLSFGKNHEIFFDFEPIFTRRLCD